MAYTTVVSGTAITATWGNSDVRDQVIVPFASTAARDAAITSPVNGMRSYTTDTGTAWIYNGSAWVEWGTTGAWKSWTPTLTNMTLGNGTLDCQYFKIGRTVHWKFKFTLGTTSTVGTSPYFSVPFAYSDGTEIEGGFALAVDQSASTRYPLNTYGVGSGIGFYCLNSGGTYLSAFGITATIPFTWANTDVFFAWGTYEATS